MPACVRLKPGSNGFRMCPLLRTGGGGGGAFFLTDELATPTVLDGGGIDCDRLEWFDTAVTFDSNNKSCNNSRLIMQLIDR